MITFMKLNEYKDIDLFKNNLKLIIECKNNCKLNYSSSFNSFWFNDWIDNELRLLFLNNISLTISRVSFHNKRIGTMTNILKEIISFCEKNNIERIVVQSVLSEEMANFCIKNNFTKQDNDISLGFYGDYILYLKKG